MASMMRPKLEIGLGLNKLGLGKGLQGARKDLDGLDKSARSSVGTLGKLRNAFKSLGGKALGFAGGILLANVITKVAGAVKGLISASTDFDEQMRNVNSIAQLSEKSYKGLYDQVLQLAEDKRITDMPATLAAGLYQIVSAGFSASDALTILRASAIAATAGLTDTATSSTAIVAVLNAYGLSAADATKVSNQLFQIVNLGVLTFPQLATAIGTVLPTAAALGVSLDDVGAAIITMTRQGIDADTAMTDLNAIMVGILKPSENMQAGFEAAGYASGQAALDALGFAGTMDLINQIIANGTGNIGDYIVNVRDMRGVQALAAQGGKVYADAQDGMSAAQEGAGATAKALAEQMKSLRFQINLAKKNVVLFFTEGFGGRFTAALASGLRLVNDFAARIFKLTDKFKAKGQGEFLASLHAFHIILSGWFGRDTATQITHAVLMVRRFILIAIGTFRLFHKQGLSLWDSLAQGIAAAVDHAFGAHAANKVLAFFKQAKSAFYTFLRIAKTGFTILWPIVKAVFGFIASHLKTIAMLAAIIYVGVKAFRVATAAIKVFNAVLKVTRIIMLALDVEMLPLILIIAAIAVAAFLLYKAWKGNWFGIRDITHKVIGAVVRFVTPAIDVIKKLIGYIRDVATHKIEAGDLAKLPGWLRPIAFVLGRITKTLRVFIKTWQDKGLVAALKTIPAQIRAFGRAVAGLLDSMGLHHTADMIKATFYDIAKLVRDVINLVDDLVHGRWQQVWHDFLRIAVDVFWLMIDRIATIGALIVDIFNLIPWGTIGGALKSAGAFLMRELWRGVKSLSGWITDKLVGWAPTIVADILTISTLLYNAGRTLLSWVWTGIASLLDWLKGQASAIGGKVLDAVNGFGQMLYYAGQNAVIGIWNGIASMGGWLYSLVVNFVKNHIIGAVSFGLLSHSPSKAMIPYGKSVPQGVAIGIDKHAHLAAAAASRMVARVTGARAGSATSSAAGSAGITVNPAAIAGRGSSASGRAVQIVQHIYPAAGMDEEALANKAAKHIRREIVRLQAAGS